MKYLDEGVDIPRTEQAISCLNTGNPGSLFSDVDIFYGNTQQVVGLYLTFIYCFPKR